MYFLSIHTPHHRHQKKMSSDEETISAEPVTLGNAIVNTSEANIVDLYIQKKLSPFDFFYKLTCGALVGMVSLQANSMVKELVEVISERLEDFVRRKSKIERYFIHLLVEIITIAAVFEASVTLARMARVTMSSPSEEEEDEE